MRDEDKKIILEAFDNEIDKQNQRAEHYHYTNDGLREYVHMQLAQALLRMKTDLSRATSDPEFVLHGTKTGRFELPASKYDSTESWEIIQ